MECSLTGRERETIVVAPGRVGFCSRVLFRDSGMPEQGYWESLFDVSFILKRFGFGPSMGDVVELGCGYGTFTIPLAGLIGGRVVGIDLNPFMVATTRQRAAAAQVRNVQVSVSDVLAEGFGMPAGSCDAALLFNILHCEEPVQILRAARAVVRPGGLVAVIHWRSDLPTPRGPDLAIRPQPDQIAAWAVQAGRFEPAEAAFLLPPWHFGLRFRRDPRQST